MSKCKFNNQTAKSVIDDTLESSFSIFMDVADQDISIEEKFNLWAKQTCKYIGNNILNSCSDIGDNIDTFIKLAIPIIKNSYICEQFLEVLESPNFIEDFDFDPIIRGAITGVTQATADPETPSTTQSNVETTKTVYGKHADNELNLLFLDYAFRGMYLLRSRFEDKFTRYIWESCFINRGSIGGEDNAGAVTSQLQMNNNLKTLQESQFGILVEYYNANKGQDKNPITGTLYKKDASGNLMPTYLFDLNKTRLQDFFNQFTPEDILRQANIAESEPKTKNGNKAQAFIDAYNAFVLLSNFDSFLTVLFGKDIEMLPSTQQQHNGYMAYALANKSHTNRTTHAEADEIIVDKLINYIVKGGIETTSEYDSVTKKAKPDLYLSYSDFATVIADIKTMASSPGADVEIGADGLFSAKISDLSLSKETQAYVEKHKTLRRCITSMKLDMENNMRYVLELLNNAKFQNEEIIKQLFAQYGYDTKEKKDKLFSIYRGIFSSESDSLYHLDVNRDILYNFTQNAATIYKNAITQYYTDRRGRTRVRYLFDQEFDNLKIRLENNINGSHALKLSVEGHNAQVDEKNPNKITYWITGDGYKITVKTDTKNPKKPTITLLNTNSGLVVLSDQSVKDFFDNLPNKDAGNVMEILKQFVSNQTCLGFRYNDYLFKKYKGSGSDFDAVKDLFLFANQIKTNAILKDQLQTGLSNAKTRDDRVALVEKYFPSNDAPELLGKSFSLITPTMAPEFIRIARAVFSVKEMNMPSIVKSGNGSAYSPYSMSRLLGSIQEQVELQCTKGDSATKDSAFVKMPGLFVCVAKNLESYSYAQKGKRTVKFNTAEFMYGGFLYQFISGLMKKSSSQNLTTGSTSKDIFGDGVIGILPTTNSDKSEVNTAIFNLALFKLDNNQTMYKVLNDQKMSKQQKKDTLLRVIRDEIGLQYRRVYENISEDFVNSSNGFFTVINKYIDKWRIPKFNFNANEPHALSGFQSFYNWFNENAERLKEIGINTHKQLFDKALLWYNTEDNGRVNPAELYDQVDCTFDKNGNIKFNDTIISLLYRFNKDYVENLNVQIGNVGLTPIKLSDFYTTDEFFNYKNKKTVWDLLQNNFAIDLSLTFATNGQSAAVKEARGNNPEIVDLKARFDAIRQKEGVFWYDENSGQMIIAKIKKDGKIYDIKNYTDLYLLDPNVTEKEFLKNGKFGVEMNPLLEQYNLVDYLLSSEYTHCSVGSIISHIPKGKTSAITEREKIMATESLRYLAQTKRNVSLTAAMEGFQLGQRNGITTRARSALIQDIYALAYNNLGQTDRVKPFDGATFTNPMQVYWENNSLASARVGQTKKPYAHYYNERLMCAGMIKTAAFPLNNENMRGSSVYRNLFRMSASLKWINPDGTEWDGDITKTIEGNRIDFSTRPIYKKENGEFYRVSLEKAPGINMYYVKLQQVDAYGNLIKNMPTGEAVKIDNNYTLWEIFGGENSYSKNTEGKLVLSERSIQMIADMANDIGVVKDQLDPTDNELDFVKIQDGDGVKYFYQVLKHANIHYMPTEGAVKMFQCNMNPNTVYNDESAKLNWSYFLTTQFGIQLDKEHHADEAELSMMTQVMNACAFRGFTFDVAQNLYKALYSLNKVGTRDFIVPFEKMLDPKSTEQEVAAATKEFYAAINKSLIKTLANRAGKTDRAKQYAQEILDRERHDQVIDYAELEIPFSAKSIYRQAISSIASILTKQGIKHKISGTLSVLTPSYNCVLVYGNGKLKTDFSDFDSEINALQNSYDQDPAFDLHRNTDVDIKQITLSASNADGEYMNVDATRYSINGHDGYIDLTYNFLTNEYDIIFNMDTNGLTEEQLSSLFSVITNAVPIGKDIRFANSEVSKDNLKTYEMFREYGFLDVIEGNSEYDAADGLANDQSIADAYAFSEDKSKIIIPKMERNVLQRSEEQTQEKTDGEKFDEHFTFLEQGRRSQLYQQLMGESDEIYVFTKDKNQKDILNLQQRIDAANKKAKGKKKLLHIIEISDTDLGNQSFINNTIETIVENIRAANTTDKRNICIIGDDITKFKSKFIQQSDFNRTFVGIIQGIITGIGDQKIRILSDGQSGIGYAAVMSAKHLNQDWAVINGGKCIYREKTFVFDDRQAKDRWSESLPTGEYFSFQTSFGALLPANATFKPGTYLPDAIFQKLQGFYEEKQKEAIESFNKKHDAYIKEHNEFEDAHDKWEKAKAKYQKWEETQTGEEPKKPGKEPVFTKRPPRSTAKKDFLQDISGKSIKQIIDDYSKATDTKPSEYGEEEYETFLKPLYELWAYQNPKLILAYKNMMAKDTSKVIYDGQPANRSLARILAELLENVSWAYEFETTNLEPVFSKKQEIQKDFEQLNVMAQISNKYIGYLPSAENSEKNYLSERSVTMALKQDPDVVNCSQYQNGDIVLICTLNPKSKPKQEINKTIIDEGKLAIRDGALLLIGSDDESLSKDGALGTVEDVKKVFGNDAIIVPIRIAGQNFFAISNSQEVINASFIKQELAMAGQTWEYYVPSSLYQMLQQVNKKIMLSTHSTEDTFDQSAICAAIHEGKLDKSNWDMSSNGIDPVLYSVKTDVENTAYCFGRQESVKDANELYDLLNLLEGIARSPKDISVDGYKFENHLIAGILEDLKSKFAIVADTTKSKKERLDNYTKAKDAIVQAIDSIDGITYLGGPNSVMSKIDITKQGTRERRTFIDPEVSMMYVDAQEGRENFSNKFNDNIELNPTDESVSDSIISNGFQLNKKQSEAVRESIKLITENFGDESTKVSTIVIDGKAGTGKTSTVDAILRNLPMRITSQANLIVGALSHKAKNIISSNISESIKHGRYSSYKSLSFAQMLGIKPNADGVFDYTHIGKQAPIKNADIVVLDEISMLSNSQIDMIRLQMKPGSILLLLGDKGQLPALEDDLFNNYTIFDSEMREPNMYLSPDVGKNLVKRRFALEQNMRQGSSENPILRYAERFYDNVPEITSPNIINENESGAVYSSNLDLNDQTLKFIKESVQAGNESAIKILAYTNNEVNRFNNKIHDYLGYKKNQYGIGEFVVMKQTTNIVENSIEGKIVSVSDPVSQKAQIGKDNAERSFHTQEIQVELSNGNTVSLTVIPEMQFGQRFIENNPGLKKWMKDNDVIDVGLSYATTVHKAQGSTYDVVLIQHDDIMHNKRTTDDVKSKLMYTALTRARNIAVIMRSDNNPLRENLQEKNNHFLEQKRPVKVPRKYNVKGLQSFKQNSEDNTMIVSFNFKDSNDRFDFRKGDLLYDANDIEYGILEDPIVYYIGNDELIEQKFGGSIDANPGDIVVKVKPTNNVNVADISQMKLQQYMQENSIDLAPDSKLKKIDTSRIRIGKTYKIIPNLWRYDENVTKYNDFDIIRTQDTRKNIKEGVRIEGSQILLDLQDLKDVFEIFGEPDQTFNEYVELSIYEALQKHFNKDLTNEQVKEKARQIYDRARIKVKKLTSAEDYIDLTEQINEGKISKVIEVANVGRELSSINYIFKDTSGNKFQLMDLDSIRNLFKLKSIIKKIKSSDQSAFDELRSFGIKTVGIDYGVISDKERFNKVVKEIDSKLRIESQYDLNNLSQNTADLLSEFDKLCDGFDNTITYCDRVRDWVNYVLGRTGERKLIINGKLLELTPEFFHLQKEILRQIVANRIRVKINGQEVDVDRSTVECEPYEVVMPKVMATVYGLKAGDSVSNILDSYESKSFIENETPTNDINYLGFFGKRLMDNWNGILSKNLYDICLKNITGEHFYIISKANAKKLKDVHETSPRTTIDINGNRILLSDNGAELFQIGNDDNIIVDDLYGQKIIVTDNPELYLDNIKYSYITLGNNIDDANIDRYIDCCFSVYESGTNEQLNNIIDELKDSSESAQIKEVFKDYLKSMSSSSSKFLLENFRTEGLRMYASFKTTLDIVASRIPAQCQHSFMPMRVAGFVDSDVNNAFVSTDQIWLQGSDYDIDTVSLATYSVDKGGKLYLWSPYAKYDTYEEIQQSRKIPAPSSVEYKIRENDMQSSNDDTEYLDGTSANEALTYFNQFGRLFKPSDKKHIFFELDKKVNTPNIIALLKTVPKLIKLNTSDTKDLRDTLEQYGFVDSTRGISDEELIKKFNNSLLYIFNKHNLYLRRIKSPHVQRQIANNITISSMIEVSKDPANMIESRTPIDSCKDEWNEIADTSKKNDIEYRQPGSVTLKANGIVENQVGKDCISIAAVGLKALSAIQYYYDLIMNSDQDPRQNSLYFNITINGRHYDLPSDVRPKSPNTLNTQLLRKLLDAGVQNDPALAVSALLSLSVDNAKDLSLNKLNANPATLGMYIFGVTIGVPVDTLTKIIMGPIGDLAIQVLQANSFTDQTDSFNTLFGVFSYLEQGPWKYLKRKYNFMSQNGERTKKTVYQELCQLAGGEEILKKAVMSKNQDDTPEKKIAFLNELKAKYIEARKGTGRTDFSAKVCYAIDELITYVTQAEVINAHQEEFKDFKKLFEGAQEMKTLGQILSLNQGLKNKEDQSDRMLISLEEMLGVDNAIDLEQFVFNKEARDKAIKEFENKKVAFNSLAIIFGKEDVYGFLKALTVSTRASLRSAKYRFGLDNYKKVKTQLKLSSVSDADIIKGLRQFYDDLMLDEFLVSKNQKFKIPKGGIVFDQDGNSIQTEGNIELVLGSDINNASFRAWVEQDVIPYLKAQFPGNEFVAGLGVVSSNKTVSHNEELYYSIPTINLSPREKIDQHIFDKYVNAYMRLSTVAYGGIPIHDIFAYYNIIAQRRNLGENTFTKLVDASNSRIVSELEQFIAEADKHGDRYTVGYNTADIKVEDVLPYVVPIFSAKTANSGYVRKRNPHTGQWTILRNMDAFSKKGNSYYDEDEYYDIPYDFEYTEETRRANWYDSNFEEIRSKVDTQYFRTGSLQKSSRVKFTGPNGEDLIIIYATDQDKYGYHKIYDVRKRNDVMESSYNFGYGAVKITYENGEKKLTFDKKKIDMNKPENDSENINLEEIGDSRRLIELGKRPDEEIEQQEDGKKQRYYPRISVQFNAGKLSSFEIEFSDGVRKIPAEQLKGRNNPIIISRNKKTATISRDTLIKVIKAQEKKKQNGC